MSLQKTLWHLLIQLILLVFEKVLNININFYNIMKFFLSLHADLVMNNDLSRKASVDLLETIKKTLGVIFFLILIALYSAMNLPSRFF